MGQESMKNANMSEAEIMQFNAPFEAYKGVKTGTEVKTLFNKITAHNRTAKDDSQRVVVEAVTSGSAPAGSGRSTDWIPQRWEPFRTGWAPLRCDGSCKECRVREPGFPNRA